MLATRNARFAVSLVMLLILGLVVACGGTASDDATTANRFGRFRCTGRR